MFDKSSKITKMFFWIGGYPEPILFFVTILLLLTACQSKAEAPPFCTGDYLWDSPPPIVLGRFRELPQFVWSDDGKQILFQTDPNTLYLTDVEQEPGVSIVLRQFSEYKVYGISELADSTMIFYTQQHEDNIAYVVSMDISTQTEIQLIEGGYPLPSPDGRQLAFIREDGLYVMKMGNGTTNLVVEGYFRGQSWHPDSTKLAYYGGSNEEKIHILDLSNGENRKISDNDYCEWYPAWSADGEMLAYIATYEDNLDIFAIEEPNDTPVNLTQSDLNEYQFAWHPEQKQMAIVVRQEGEVSINQRQMDIYLLDVETGNLKQLTQTPNINESFPRWSPQGDKLAFIALEGNKWFVEVLTLESGERIRIGDPERWE